MNASPDSEPRHDWAEDLAHDRLIAATRDRLAAAHSAAEDAEDAAAKTGRDLTDGTESTGA